MNQAEFDNRMKRMAAEDGMKLRPEAEERFRDAMESAWTQAGQRGMKTLLKGKKLASWAPVMLAAAIALLLVFLPQDDEIKNGALPLPTPEMSPVTQNQQASAPTAVFEAHLLEGKLRLDGRLQNRADDIWLVEWSARTRSGEQGDLIWLEPGADCAVSAVWEGETQVDVAYVGYRVTADILHWMDGEYLSPGMEGYADQQELIEEAFRADALILAPGDWENGEAGPMQLVLPASYWKENPQTNVVQYYLQKGLIVDGSALCGGQQQMQLHI